MKKAIVTALLIASAMASGVGAHAKSVSINSISYNGESFELSPYEVEYVGNIRLDVLMVEDIEEDGDLWLMTSVDQNGNEWQTIEEDGDMFKGDIIAVMFDDMGTSIIYDDEVVSWRYCGWVSDEEAEEWVKR